MFDVTKIKVPVGNQQAQLTARLWQNILLGIWEKHDILKEKSEISG
jgi:hypothetical protein